MLHVQLICRCGGPGPSGWIPSSTLCVAWSPTSSQPRAGTCPMASSPAGDTTSPLDRPSCRLISFHSPSHVFFTADQRRSLGASVQCAVNGYHKACSLRVAAAGHEGVLLQVRGFRGERWWVWVAMAVLASGIVILNILTAVLNHIMPSERPQPLPALFWEAQEAASTILKICLAAMPAAL